MAYLTQSYLTFFKGLSKNNNREWFQEHRVDYEEHVKAPFHNLVADLLVKLQKLDSDIEMTPKEAIFRINRDIRFSKDKTPYNTVMKAGFAKGGRKSPYAGYYLGIGLDGIHIGGGIYGVDKENLHSIRSHIAANEGALNKLVRAKKFVDLFGEVKGEANKRIPSEFQEVFESTPLIANKQFYYMATYTGKDHIVRDDLLSFLLNHCKAITPLNSFFKEGVQTGS